LCRFWAKRFLILRLKWYYVFRSILLKLAMSPNGHSVFLAKMQIEVFLFCIVGRNILTPLFSEDMNIEK